jgi:hypothetical protein
MRNGICNNPDYVSYSGKKESTIYSRCISERICLATTWLDLGHQTKTGSLTYCYDKCDMSKNYCVIFQSGRYQQEDCLQVFLDPQTWQQIKESDVWTSSPQWAEVREYWGSCHK